MEGAGARRGKGGMRILFLLTQDLDGSAGGGRYFPLARSLAQRGHQVFIAGLHSSFDELEERSFQVDGVGVEYPAPMHVRRAGNLKTYYPAYRLVPLMAWATLGLARSALRQPFDIIHIGKPHPMNSVAGLLARYLRGRRVWLDVDDYEAATNTFSGAWQRHILSFFEDSVPRLVERITTHTEFLRRRLISLGIPDERISYLPNGFDPERFWPPSEEALCALKKELNLEGCQVVAFIGSLSLSNHPVDLLVEAFQIISRQEPAARLLLVGGGEDYPRIRTQVEEAGLENHVIFRGRVPFSEAPIYYRLAHVTVDPVRDDDAARSRQPIKLFESLASGVPFVTADVGDRRALLEAPSAGLLARPGDPQSLAEVILKVLREPETAATLRENGYARVQAFRWERIAADLEALYQREAR